MMCEEMGLTHLQQTLRSLCFKSDWKYAVFWKLKHRTRMMLTWEDAYYANHKGLDPSDQMQIKGDFSNSRDGQYMQDPLGLAVAKMSYLVYSLGEGIIGQVAVTGKHQWIFADNPTSHCWSSSEYCGGWQTQFSAGIKTIAVVAVVPHGVLQLGSLHKVTENKELINHIRDVFSLLQNSSVQSVPYNIPFTSQSMSEISAKISGSEVYKDFPSSSDNASISHRNINAQSYRFPSTGVLYNVHQDIHTLPGVHQKKEVDVVNDNESGDLFHTNSIFLNPEQQKQVQRELNSKTKCEEVKSGWKNTIVDSKKNYASIPYNNSSESPEYDHFVAPLDEFVSYPFIPSRISAVGDGIKFDKVAHLQNQKLLLSIPFGMQMTESEVSCTDAMNSSLRFSAGCELHEALGPAFMKQHESCSMSELDRNETAVIEPLERTSSSLLITDNGPDYLLEAVVANSSTFSSNAKSVISLCKSADSFVTTGKTPDAPTHVKHGSGLASGSVVHSALSVEDALKNLKPMWDSTEVCYMRSSKDSSSRTPSTSSKHSEMQTEPTKGNRKRARPGENSRPRPRDRQLIQDRVKELRELVPNGSKCSIDSLLEQTIKHMFFLQNVTKHAEKLRKCVESKFRDNNMSLLGSCSHEHGSSWALEVGGGGPEELCPLVVENLNMDGQMLVEMLCKECSRFLEIAEAIRSLGLTILKGATEARGDNIWACFVVEGHNNRGMHRMDVLWSLVQLLQPKTTI